jgi:murein DD-endopeptidase MepM/ murein hydrolase activator NlpD
MAERQAQTSMQSFAESLRSRRLSPVNPSAITGGRPIRLSGNIIAKKEIEELGQIRKTLGTLLAIEKRYYSFLGDRILNFAKEEQRRKSRERERLQEEGRGRSGKKSNANSIVEKAKSDISMIGEFFKNLLKFFVGYKVLQWASNPANSKKIQDFVTLFTKIFKFISAVTEFGVDVLMKTITVTSKVINGVFDFVGKVAEFFSFRWIGGGVEWLLKTIEDVTSVFASIPNAISLTVKFLTNLLPNFLESVLTNGLLGGQKELQGQAEQSVDTKKPVESPAETSAESDKTGQGDLGEKAKESLSNIGKNILKTLFPGIDIATNIGAKIGGSVKSLFTGSKSQEELPKLAKGGIVTKPTEAIVGEAGPEAILPLDKLGSFGIDGFKAATNKVIPKFMTLLTLPFKIIGAGILALISSTVGKIPGIGQFIKPLVSNIASGFGLPPGLVSGMTGFVGGVGEMVTSGMGDVAELFGKKDININQQKGEDFNASRDTTVKGLLGNILGALISKQQKTAPATTPPGPPATPAPAPAATPAPAAPAGSPAAPSAAPAMSPIFDRSSTSGAVPGQGAGDKIPALLEPNEYVLNKNAVNGMGGPKVLDQINYGLYPRFGTGGPTNSAKKFLKLGEGWVPVPEDSKNIHLGRRMSGKHGGTDIPMPVGTPLLAPFDGTVKENGKNPGGWGNFMVIKSTSGAYSLFGHVSQYVKKQGERVSAGEQVALSGHQHGGGRSSGPHLHWEIGSSWNGTMGGKIDPITWSSGKAIPSVSGQTTSTATDAHSPSENTSPEITAEMAASAAESLGKLFKMLNAPSANQELTSTPKSATLPKITQTVSQSSANLQRVQKENLQLQSQSRNQSKTGGNVITLGQPNKTITQTTSQPMTAALGNTTPPNPLINYPIAP